MVDFALAVLLAYDGDALEFGVLCEVACLCHGIEDGDALLAFYLNSAHLLGLAEHGVGEVGDLRCDERVGDEAAALEFFLYALGELAAGKSTGLYFAEDGEVDGAVFGDGVSGVGACGGCAVDGAVVADGIAA